MYLDITFYTIPKLLNFIKLLDTPTIPKHQQAIKMPLLVLPIPWTKPKQMVISIN